MKTGKTVAAITLSAAVLSGCATGAVDRNFQFSASSPKGLAVFAWDGLDAWWGKSVFLYLRGVGPDGLPDKRFQSVSNGNGWKELQKREWYVVEMEPGTYFADFLTVGGGYNTFQHLFCLGTITFQVDAGRAKYFGNIAIAEDRGRISAVQPDFDGAQQALAQYPNVHEKLVEDRFRAAPHPPSRACKTGSS